MRRVRGDESESWGGNQCRKCLCRQAGFVLYLVLQSRGCFASILLGVGCGVDRIVFDLYKDLSTHTNNIPQ